MHEKLAIMLAAWSVAAGCSEKGQCGAACVDQTDVIFSPPISAPGRYSVQIGSVSYEARLPYAAPGVGLGTAPSSVSLVRRTIEGAEWQNEAAQELDVTIEKDGEAVIVEHLEPTSRNNHEVCGATCTNAAFELEIPDQLTSLPPEQCATEPPDGAYDVGEASLAQAGCSHFDEDGRLELAAGAMVGDDPACAVGELVYDAETCRLYTTLACSGPSLSASWYLEVEDALGDGSRLLGRGVVEVQGSAACTGEFVVELERRD